MIMKTEKEIHRFYAKTILPDLKNLELKRRKIHAVLKITKWISLALWIGLSFILIPITEHWWEGFIASMMMALCLYAFFSYHLTRNYKKQVKQKIIHKLLKFLTEELRLEPNKKIPKGSFLRSKIFMHKLRKYEGKNLISGEIDKTRFSFSEITAKTSVNNDDVTFFKGLFFIADFNKHFRTETIVLPDIAETLLGPFGQTLQSMNVFRSEIIKMENSKFEKLFVVYGEDQIEARYILSPSLMDRIVKFQEKYDRCVYLSFVDSRVFVGIHSLNPSFEPSVFTSLFSYDQIKEYCEMIQMPLAIVKDLDLNTRIWTKD